MTSRRGELRWLLLPVVGLLALSAVAVPFVLAHPGPSSVSGPRTAFAPPQQWANDTNSSYNTSMSYNGTEFLGSFVASQRTLLLATNLSSTDVELEQMVTGSFVTTEQLCVPNCSTPNGSLTESQAETAVGVAFLNLTSAATVDENGSSAAALGATNSSQWGYDNSSLTLTATGNLSDLFGGLAGPANLSGQSYENTTEFGRVAFASPLGLLPWNVSGTSPPWNSSSPFTAFVSLHESFGSTFPSYNGSANGSGYGGGGGSGYGAPGYGNGSGFAGAPPPPSTGGFGGLASSCGNGGSGAPGGGGASNGSASWNGSECVVGTELTSWWNTSVAGIVLQFVGPFALPVPLLAFVGSSDLFGGAGHGWVFASPGNLGMPPGAYGTGTQGPPGVTPGPNGPVGPVAPPIGAPPPRSGAPPRTGGSSQPTPSSSSSAAPAMETAWIVAAVVLAGLTLLAVVLTVRRRR